MQKKTRSDKLAETRKFWEEQITTWQDSDLSQAEFCRKNNLIAHRFTYWKQKLVKRQEKAVSLVQVSMETNFNTKPAYRSPLRIVFNNQLHVEVDRDFDPVTLRQLVYTLKQA